MRQGDPATAEQLCSEALQRRGLRPQTSAMLHGQLGLLALERGDLVGGDRAGSTGASRTSAMIASTARPC